MSLLDELRAAYPDNEKLKAISDPELVSLYAQATGSSLDLAAMDLGLDPNQYIQNTGRGQDLVNQGILGLGDIVSGVAGFFDIPIAAATDSAPFSKAVDWAADATGLSDYGKRLDVTMSPQSQETRSTLDKQWNDEEVSAWDKTKNIASTLWDDPTYALELAARSAPTLVPAIGGAKLLGMGAKAMEAAGLTRTAAVRPLIPGMAEGGVAAGYQMNNLLEEDVAPREAAGYSALTGVGTGVIGGVTGALGARAGLTDPHRALAGYRLPNEAPALPWYQRIPGGMAMEAGQEALQSPWEQAMTNVATDQPWDQGLARSAVEGALAGGVIGAPFNIFRGREIDLIKPSDTPETEQQATPVPPGINPPGNQTPNIDPLAAERQRQIDAIMGGETSQTILPGQADPGSLQGLTRDQVNQRLIDAAMGGETSRTFAPGQYPSDVAADLSQQQAKVNATRAAEQAKKAVEKQYEKAGWQKTPEKIALLETAQAPKLVSGIYGDEARKFVDSVLTMDAKTAGELFTNLSGSKSKSAPWKGAIAKAHLTNLTQQEAQTLAQQAKQNATIDAPGVPVTPTIAQNAQPVEGAVPPTPTTSSVAQDEVDEEFAREMPPITPPPSPITSEIPTNALSGQTTPQAGQETRTTAPDATTEPGVTEAPKVPKTQQKIIVDENVLGWQNAFNAAVDRVAGVRNLSDKAKTTFSELMQRYYQVGRFSTYAGVKPPSYDAMAARLRRDGHEVSHTQVSKYISDFQDGYAAAMGQEGQPVTFEKPDENTWGYALDDGNYLGKRDIGATAASEDYVDLQDSRANDTEVDIAPDGEAALPEQAAPANQFGEMADDATIDDELGYQTGSVGGVNEFVSGGRGGAEGVSARPRVVKYFAKRHLFATNQARAARGESPLTEAEAKAELGKLSDEVLGRYLDRLRKAAVSDARLADPKDAKPKLTAAYQGLQDDMAALGAGALRATKNNRVVEELEEPDTGTATPGAVVAWQQATQSIPNAPTLGTLSVDLAGMWEEAYNESIDLPDVHRAPALRKIARRLISEQNTRPARRDTAGATAQPQAGDTTQTGSGQDMAGSVPESGDAQPELAGRGSAAPEPDIVIGAKDASNVAITTRKKRRVAPPAEPQVQQGLGEGVAENPTTEQALRDTIASLLGKGHNWRIHVYATPEAARAASRAKSEAGNAYGWAESDQEIGNAYGWVESDQKGVKHAYFIVNRIEQGTELGKFLHEVGAHIGLENVLSPALYQNLVGQLRKWVALNNDSLESRLAKAALARVEYAQAENTRTRGEGLDQVEQDSELIAYFLEEAIKAGIDPTATKANSPLGTWFMRLWTAFKRALRKLRIENLDQLQPQHVVDLAYGAARLELNTYWHGTAANFRRFNHDYMGSGEGAQVYSWGTYLAQVFGVGKGYFNDDVRRKTNGVVTFDGVPLSEQKGLPYQDDLKAIARLVERGGTPLQAEIDRAIQNYQRVVDRRDQEIAYFKNKFPNEPIDGFIENLPSVDFEKGAIRWLTDNRHRLAEPTAPEGSLMRVDVNATPDEIMSWNLPLNRQPQKVQEVIRQHFGEDLINDEDLLTMTGEELYKRVLANNKWSDPEMWTYVTPQDMATDGKPVSEWFDSVGIKGMEHWDGASRGLDNIVVKVPGEPNVRFTPGTDEFSVARVLDTASSLQEALQELEAGSLDYLFVDDPSYVKRLVKNTLQELVAKNATYTPRVKTTNLVVFNDKNIYRVARAPGGDTTPGKVQYGVDIPSHASAISEAVQNQLSKGGTGVKSNLLGWLRLDQLAEQYGKQLPMVAELNKLFNQMSAKAKHWLNRADHVIRMWDMLTPKQKELMHWIMGNATVEGYDPDDTKTTAKNDQQRLLDQKWKQLQALDAANPKMKAATVYRAARKHYQDDMQEAIDYLNGLKTQAKGANDKQLDSMITTLKALTKKSKGVYFPLMRFGDFYTVGMSSQLHALHQKRKALLDKGQALDEAEEKLYQKLRKDEKHYQVTGHDSERQARKHADKLRAQGMQATNNVGRYSQDAVRNTLSKDIDSFNKLLAELDVPKGVASRLQTAYESLLIDALPEGHTLKRQMDRDGIAGWDTDMRRVFAKSTQSRAFALSRLINMRQVQEQMAQLKRAGESFAPNAQLASPLYNELMARQELAYTRSEDPWWTRTATTWNYLTMLSFSPAFWLLNLSQVPVVTLPWLAARNDNQYRATMTGLAKAAGQTAKLIKWSIEGNEWRAELDTTRAIPGITQDEKQLLLDMQDAGKLEFTIGQDIGAVAEGKSDFWARLTRSINTPTHATELINRASTALTAYRISRKNGNDHAKAVEFAIRASDTTHVNYDPVVGARNMQTVFKSAPLAKIVFQFWKFQQGMAYLALSTMKDAWNHPDPAIKKQARDTAIGMTLTLTSTAGAFGLPFVGSALGLLTLAFGLDGDDDEDDDAGRMLKNWMHDYLPGPVEDYLTKGIWGWFDGPDPSARFSMGGLMNPLAFARFDDTERGEDTLKEIMFRVFGGATGASAAAIWDGLSAVGDGDYTKAGEKLLPLKFLRDLAKTVTLNTEGLATGKGEQRLDPNDFLVADSIWQAMGIQPAKKTNYYDRQGAIQAQKQAVEGTRDKLLAEYGQARMQGKDVSPIVVKITRFNQRNPHARIKAENLRQAVDRRKTNRRETDATGMLVNKQTRPYLENARWTE